MKLNELEVEDIKFVLRLCRVHIEAADKEFSWEGKPENFLLPKIRNTIIFLEKRQNLINEIT